MWVSKALMAVVEVEQTANHASTTSIEKSSVEEG